MSYYDICQDIIAISKRLKIVESKMHESTEDHHKVIKQRTKQDWSRSGKDRRSARSVEFRLARWNAFDPDEDEISRELRLCWGRRSDDNPSVK